MSDIAGKTALITGASRGIGAAAARAFANAGANVVLCARTLSEIRQIAAEIGDTARAVACDVSDYAQVADAVRLAEGTFGRLDILVNNAGAVDPVARLAEADPAAWAAVIDVNLKGVFNGMRAALPGMLGAGAGTILTIGSGAAHGPVEGWSHYCASKAGAYMLTRMAHEEYGPRGIRALSLSPGTVATDMQRVIKASGINPVSQLDWSAHIPPEWVASALVWMCGSDADSFLGAEVSLRDPDIRRKVGVA